MNKTVSLLMLVGLLACYGTDEEAAEGLVQDTRILEEVSTPADDVAEDLTAGEVLSGAIDMNGVWAQVQVVATLAQAPLLGTIKTRSVAVLKYDVEQDGPALLMHEEVCALRLETDSDLTETVVPDAFVNALPHVSKPASVDLEAVPPTLFQPQFVELHGVELEDPENEPMPASADDPRVVDLDGDGHPGLTIYVTGIIDGALYIIQRNRIALDGAFEGPDKVAGLMKYEQEQVVLGSDNQLLADHPPVSSVDPEAENTFFISVRMPSDATCADILAAGDELFDLN